MKFLGNMLAFRMLWIILKTEGKAQSERPVGYVLNEQNET